MKERRKETRPMSAAADSKIYARRKKEEKTFEFQYIIFTGRLNKLQRFKLLCYERWEKKRGNLRRLNRFRDGKNELHVGLNINHRW